jgi:hypothetical protein
MILPLSSSRCAHYARAAVPPFPSGASNSSAAAARGWSYWLIW